jgi:hypothetical protein
MNKRGRVQFHLSSLLLVLLITATLMLLNFHPQPVYITNFSSENFEVTHELVYDFAVNKRRIYEDFAYDPEYKWYEHRFMRFKRYGWPLIMFQKMDLVYFTNDGWNMVPEEDQVRWGGIWYDGWRLLFWNALVWLGIVSFAIFVVERSARRTLKTEIA